MAGGRLILPGGKRACGSSGKGTILTDEPCGCCGPGPSEMACCFLNEEGETINCIDLLPADCALLGGIVQLNSSCIQFPCPACDCYHVCDDEPGGEPPYLRILKALSVTFAGLTLCNGASCIPFGFSGNAYSGVAVPFGSWSAPFMFYPATCSPSGPETPFCTLGFFDKSRGVQVTVYDNPSGCTGTIVAEGTLYFHGVATASGAGVSAYIDLQTEDGSPPTFPASILATFLMLDFWNGGGFSSTGICGPCMNCDVYNQCDNPLVYERDGVTDPPTCPPWPSSCENLYGAFPGVLWDTAVQVKHF